MLSLLVKTYGCKMQIILNMKTQNFTRVKFMKENKTFIILL